MTDSTARLALPLLAAGQSQKEVWHNEALALLDVAVAPSVLSLGDNAPPSSPGDGACRIVGNAPTGAWTGRAHAIACWTGGGWRFVPPVAGMLAWVAPAGVWAWYDGASWTQGVLPASGIRVDGEQVLGARQPAIASATGGATVDAEARTALDAILAALRNHGLISV